VTGDHARVLGSLARLGEVRAALEGTRLLLKDRMAFAETGLAAMLPPAMHPRRAGGDARPRRPHRPVRE
jgi:hypothetical protein